MDWVLKDATIVNEGRSFEGDVGIANGRIERIGAGLAGRREIALNGAWLLPGMIDDQVHFREPGLTHKGDIATESRAAVAGGITSYMEMPNCQPQTINNEALLAKHRLAAGRSMANYAFYLGATNHNLEAIKSVDVTKACGVKVFMGASTGNMLVDDVDTLERIFAASPLLIATHCEDTPTILANEAQARAEYGDAVPFQRHPHIRSTDACYKSSSLAVSLAKRYGSRLHVLHLTTARELAQFEPGPIRQQEDHRRGLRSPSVLQRHVVRAAWRRHQVQSRHQDPRRPTGSETRRRCGPHRRDRHRSRAAYPGGEGAALLRRAGPACR